MLWTEFTDYLGEEGLRNNCNWVCIWALLWTELLPLKSCALSGSVPYELVGFLSLKSITISTLKMVLKHTYLHAVVGIKDTWLDRDGHFSLSRMFLQREQGRPIQSHESSSHWGKIYKSPRIFEYLGKPFSPLYFKKLNIHGINLAHWLFKMTQLS